MIMSHGEKQQVNEERLRRYADTVHKSERGGHSAFTHIFLSATIAARENAELLLQSP